MRPHSHPGTASYLTNCLTNKLPQWNRLFLEEILTTAQVPRKGFTFMKSKRSLLYSQKLFHSSTPHHLLNSMIHFHTIQLSMSRYTKCSVPLQLSGWTFICTSSPHCMLHVLHLLKGLHSPRIIGAVLCVDWKTRVVPYERPCHRNWIQSALFQLTKECTAA